MPDKDRARPTSTPLSGAPQPKHWKVTHSMEDNNRALELAFASHLPTRGYDWTERRFSAGRLSAAPPNLCSAMRALEVRAE